MRAGSSLRGGVASVALIRGGTLVAQTLAFVFLARSTGVEVVARVGIATAVWALSRSLLPLGWDIALLRVAVGLRSAGKAGTAQRLVHCALRDTVACWLVSVLVVTPLLMRFVSLSLVDCLAVQGVALTWAMIGVLASYARACSSVALTQLVDGGGTQILPQVAVIVLLALGIHVDLLHVAACSGVGAVLSLVLLVRIVHLERIARRLPPIVEAADTRRLALRLWIAQVAGLLPGRAVTVITVPVAGYAAGGVVEAGLRLQQVGGTLAWVMGMVVSPRYAQDVEDDDRRRGALLNVSTWAAFLPSLALALLISLAGPHALGVLGEEYQREWVAMSLMAWAGVADAVGASCGYFFAMVGLERQASWIAVFQSMVLVTGIVLLGGRYAAQGATAAVLLATTSRALLSLAVLRRHEVCSPLGLSYVRRARRGCDVAGRSAVVEMGSDMTRSPL